MDREIQTPRNPMCHTPSMYKEVRESPITGRVVATFGCPLAFPISMPVKFQRLASAA
jgi:hypothetical protein